MKNTPESVREQISALVDGRLQGDELAQVVDRLGADDALQETWRTYHVVGDVLRAGRPAACTDGAAFLARFQERLSAEPATLRPAVPVAASAPRPVAQRQPVEAANEPVFRWKLVAGAASLAAAAAIGWNWMGSGLGAPGAGAQMAQQSTPAQSAPALALADAGNSVLAAVQGSGSGSAPQPPTRVVVGSDSGRTQVMLRDPRLDQLLEAHRQASGGAQMPSGFLRNATFEGSAR